MNGTALKKEEEETSNDFRGYSLFNDVESPSVQAYNRCCVIRNIVEAHSRAIAEEYAEALDPAGRAKTMFMFAYIKAHGWDAVNAEISRDNNE